MAQKNVKDSFANIAYLTVTQSAANTLTFAQLSMANSLLSEKLALIVHRAELYLSSWANFNASGDYVDIGLALSDRISSISDLSQPELLFFERFEMLYMGAAATGVVINAPVIRDFNDLPGGGILVPADRLYAGINTANIANVQTAYMRIWYTVQGLQEAEYWQLIEARRIMTT